MKLTTKLERQRAIATNALGAPQTVGEPQRESPPQGEGDLDARTSSKSVQKVLGGEARVEERKESPGTKGARLGSKLLDSMKRSWASTLVKAALVGVALLATPVNGNADTIFLDHNNAPMEIKVAKQLAAEIGEKFVLVRPDSASLDALFARAERGEINLRHLILSGHSSGLRVWGSGDDGTRRETTIDEMKAFKARYPKAFAQVKHVTFMSCYAGNMGNSAQWLGVFDSARFLFGFAASAPAGDKPAGHMMLASTEREARKLDNRRLTPAQALVEAKRIARLPGVNITTFATRVDGQWFGIGSKSTALDQLQDAVNILDARAFGPYFRPMDATHANPPTNHANSPLRDYYTALQALLGGLAPDSYEATQTVTKIETTIRLIYWDKISAAMQREHGPAIDSGLVALRDLGALTNVPQTLAGKTRMEIVAFADSIAKVTTPQFAGFAQKHAGDLATVNAYFTTKGDSEVTVPTLEAYEWGVTWQRDRLKPIVEDGALAPEVRAAAQRLIAALDAKAPESFVTMKKLVVEGLRDLNQSLVPSTWID